MTNLQINEQLLADKTLPVAKKGTSSPFDPEVLKYATDIDRRQCKRVVPMEVLVLGLSRTGTASIRHALFELGFFDVYHGSSYCNENPRDCEVWVDALRGKFEGVRKFEKEDWDRLFGHCMAVTDVPSYAFAEELMDAYPEAKVILSMRDSAEAWKRSMMATVIPSTQAFEKSQESAIARVLQFFLPKSHYQPMFGLTTKYTKLLDVPQRGEEMYTEHNAWIRDLAARKGSKLLEFNVKQGWKPLCEFLGKDIPGDRPFPRMNDEKKYHETVKAFEAEMGKQAFLNMALWVLLPVGAVFVAVRWMR